MIPTSQPSALTKDPISFSMRSQMSPKNEMCQLYSADSLLKRFDTAVFVNMFGSLASNQTLFERILWYDISELKKCREKTHETAWWIPWIPSCNQTWPVGKCESSVYNGCPHLFPWFSQDFSMKRPPFMELPISQAMKCRSSQAKWKVKTWATADREMWARSKIGLLVSSDGWIYGRHTYPLDPSGAICYIYSYLKWPQPTLAGTTQMVNIWGWYRPH